MATKTFSFRTSKDKVVGLYLDGRTVYDHSGTVDKLEGVVKVIDEGLLTDRVLVLQVTCDYVYEDADWTLYDEVLFSKEEILYPSDAAEVTTGAQRALIKKVGRPAFPFSIRIPAGLPASLILKPETYHEGKPVGISWLLRAFMRPSYSNSTAKISPVLLPFQKINYLPILPNIKPPSVTGHKTFMFESNSPLTLKVSLEKDVFMHGESINVKVEIDNQSKKDVCAIRISVKQIVESVFKAVNASSCNLHEKFKSQVATLESTRGCPIKKHSEFVSTYSVTPKVLSQETHHVSQEYKLNLADPAKLASTTRLNHSKQDESNRVKVSYYMNVHAIVALGADLIVKIPFSISYPEPPRSEPSPVSNSCSNASATTMKDSDSSSPVVNASQPAPNASPFASSKPALSQPDADLLIDFESEELPHSMPSSALHDMLTKGAAGPNSNNKLEVANAAAAASFNPFDLPTQDDAAAAHGGSGNVGGFSSDPFSQSLAAANPYENPFAISSSIAGSQPLQGMDQALRLLKGSIFETQQVYTLVSTGQQAATVLNDSQPLESRILQFVQAIRCCGSSVSQVGSAISLVRRNTDQAAATASVVADVNTCATAFRNLSVSGNILMSHIREPNIQHALLSGVRDMLEKAVLLCDAVQRVLLQPASMDDRSSVNSLSEYISQGLPAIIRALPGQRECQAAIDTITTATSHLDDPIDSFTSALQNPVATASAIVASANLIHSRANAFSEAFKALGLACQTAGNVMSVAKAANDYRITLPPVLAAGREMAHALPDARLKHLLLNALKHVCQSSVKLLTTSTSSMLDASAVARSTMETAGIALIEAMRALLSGTAQIKGQYEAVAARSTPALANATSNTPTNPAIARNIRVGGLARCDSFEGFIQQTSSQLIDPMHTSNTSIAKQYHDADEELYRIADNIAHANRTLVDSKSRHAQNSESTVLDSIFPIIVSVSNLVLSTRSRVSELSILGRSFHSANFSNRDKSYTEVVISAAKDLLKSVQALVDAAEKLIRNEPAALDSLIRSANVLSSDSSRLVAASQVQEHVNSNAQQEVDETSRSVTQSTRKLIDAAERVRAENGTLSTNAEGSSSTISTLEKDLHRNQSMQFAKKRGSLWSISLN